jgi:hypothetical protein
LCKSSGCQQEDGDRDYFFHEPECLPYACLQVGRAGRMGKVIERFKSLKGLRFKVQERCTWPGKCCIKYKPS